MLMLNFDKLFLFKIITVKAIKTQSKHIYTYIFYLLISCKLLFLHVITSVYFSGNLSIKVLNPFSETPHPEDTVLL